MSTSASPKKRVTWDDQMFPNPVVRYRDQVPEGEQRVLRNRTVTYATPPSRTYRRAN